MFLIVKLHMHLVGLEPNSTSCSCKGGGAVFSRAHCQVYFILLWPDINEVVSNTCLTLYFMGWNQEIC